MTSSHGPPKFASDCAVVLRADGTIRAHSCSFKGELNCASVRSSGSDGFTDIDSRSADKEAPSGMVTIDQSLHRLIKSTRVDRVALPKTLHTRLLLAGLIGRARL